MRAFDVICTEINDRFFLTVTLDDLELPLRT